jgi:hypothetical protein
MAGLSLHMVYNSCIVYGVKLLNSEKGSGFAAFSNSNISSRTEKSKFVSFHYFSIESPILRSF